MSDLNKKTSDLVDLILIEHSSGKEIPDTVLDLAYDLSHQLDIDKKICKHFDPQKKLDYDVHIS